MLTTTKLSNQGVFKFLSLFFCYANAEIFKSLEFHIEAGQAVNISLNIPDLTGINNFSNLVMKSPAAWDNNLKITPTFVRNYTQGEIVPPYYLLTDSLDRVTENFSNIAYVNNEVLLTSLLYTDGQLKWKYLTNNSIFSSPSIASDGTIYVGDATTTYVSLRGYNLYAINPDGNLKWKYSINSAMFSSPSIANDGTIYLGSEDYNLYAINPNGSLKWKYLTARPIHSSPSIASDGTIYVGSSDKNLYAINPNGSLKWKYLTGASVGSSPSIASDGTIYFGSGDFIIYAINPNGSLKWKYLTGGEVESSPSIAVDGTIYVGSRDYNLYAINPNGSLKWKYLTGNYIYSSPAIASDGTIYVSSSDGYLYAINPSGSLKWQYSGCSDASASIACDGTIYISCYSLHAINPNGSFKWKYSINDESIYNSSPSIASDGTIYIGSSDGLYAINSNNYFLTSPWSKFHQNNLNNGVQISIKSSLQLFDFRFLTITGSSNITKKLFIDLEIFNNQISTTYYFNTVIKSLEFNIQSGIATNIFVNISNIIPWSHNAYCVLIRTRNISIENFRITPSFVANYTEGDKIPYYYLLSDGVDSVTENFSQKPYNIHNNQISLNSLIYTDGQLKWKYLINDENFYNNGIYYSSPAIGSDGTIYVGSDDGHLYAINPNGSLRWRYLTGAIYSSPAIGSDGTIYVGSHGLCAINPDGSLKWEYLINDSMYSSPSIASDGTIYVGSNDYNLYAINPDGSLKWTCSTGNYIFSSPSIASDGTIYVSSDDNNLYAINPNGRLKWKYLIASYTPPLYSSSPAIGSDGTIYVGSNDYNLYAINPNGSLKWKYPNGGICSSSPSIASDGTIYVGSWDKNLYAINPNGSLKWKYLTDSRIFSSPSIASDGTIYVGSWDYNLYAINPNGSLKWKYLTDSRIFSSPSIAHDGTIYVGSYRGGLYAISSSNYFSTSPWPKFHQNNLNNGVQVSIKNPLQLFDSRALTINGFSDNTGKIFIDFYQDTKVLTMYIRMAANLSSIQPKISLSQSPSISSSPQSRVEVIESSPSALISYSSSVSPYSSSSSSSPKILSSASPIVSQSSQNSVLGQAFSVSPYSVIQSPQAPPSSLNIDNEFKITSNAGSYDTPVITALPDGNFVIAWANSASTDADIYAKIYTSSGTPVSEEFKFNTKTSGKQYWPSIASLNNGNFVIAWTGPDASGEGVYGQICTNLGLKVGSEFLINTETLNSQDSTSIATLNNGNFVVVWRGGSSPGSEIYGQIYTSTGNKVGSFFQINSIMSTGNQIKHREAPSVTALVNGNFVVVWGDSVKDGDFYGVVAQIFSNTGNKINGEFIVNTFIKNDQRYPSISALSDENFIVVWQNNGDLSSKVNQGIYGQIYSNYGVKQGSEILISSTSDSEYLITRVQDPKVVGLSNGNFVVAWERREISSGYGILYGQGFTNFGDKVSTEFKINYYSDGSQKKPSITGLPNGNFIIVWGSDDKNNNKRGIYGKLFKAFPNYKLTVSPSPQDYPSSAYANKPLLVSFIEKGSRLLKSTRSKILYVFSEDNDNNEDNQFLNDGFQKSNDLKFKI